ncbi:hypothetical protein Csa_023877, partial [Cucumis sativus]
CGCWAQILLGPKTVHINKLRPTNVGYLPGRPNEMKHKGYRVTGHRREKPSSV